MMVTAISVSMSGGKQSASGTNPKAEAIREIECPTVNEVTMMTSGRSRRNGITEQHRNSRGSGPLRMWQKPDNTKRSGAWWPPGIEAHEAGIAVELERARGAVGRQEAQCRGDFLAEPVDAQADREFGTVGLDRIFEQDVEQLLVPIKLQTVGEPRPFHVRTRLLIRRERSIGRQRHAGVEDVRWWKRRAVFVDGDIVDQIKLRSVAQRAVGAG